MSPAIPELLVERSACGVPVRNRGHANLVRAFITSSTGLLHYWVAVHCSRTREYYVRSIYDENSTEPTPRAEWQHKLLRLSLGYSAGISVQNSCAMDARFMK